MSQTQIKYPNTTEQTQWLTLIQTGEDQAFNHIFEKYRQSVFNLCYYRLGNTDEANEAVQETFLRVYLKLDSYDHSRLFSTWLFSIASNYCTDLLRSRQIKNNAWNKLNLWHSAGVNDLTPELLFIEAETSNEVYIQLNRLSPENCIVLVLKYWYNVSYQEIANQLDTTVSAIKSKLFRAKKDMAQASIRPNGTSYQRASPPDCNSLLIKHLNQMMVSE